MECNFCQYILREKGNNANKSQLLAAQPLQHGVVSSQYARMLTHMHTCMQCCTCMLVQTFNNACSSDTTLHDKSVKTKIKWLHKDIWSE